MLYGGCGFLFGGVIQEYHFKRNHVPAFGSWDWNDNLPFTQCFESARQGGFLHYSYSESNEDQDLYVAGDLYDNHVVTPAVIVVPRRRVCHLNSLILVFLSLCFLFSKRGNKNLIHIYCQIYRIYYHSMWSIFTSNQKYYMLNNTNC